MRKLLAILLLSGSSYLANAQSLFDLSIPSGLTVGMHGATSLSCPECGLDQGGYMVRFNENLNQSWYASCLNQRLYVVQNASGRAIYQTLLLAQLTGKKITRILGYTSNASGVCFLSWVQVE